MERTYGWSRLLSLPMLLALVLQHAPVLGAASQRVNRRTQAYLIQNVGITSLGPVGTVAKDGDTVRVTFTSTRTSSRVTVRLNGAFATCTSLNGDTATSFQCDYQVPAGVPDGSVTVVIDGQGAGGLTTVINNQAISFDSTPPTFSSITLTPTVLSGAGNAVVNFDAQENVRCDTVTGTINGKTATCAYVALPDRRKCTCPMAFLPSDPAVASVLFSFTVTDIVGNAVTISQTTDSSATEVRRIVSSITLTSNSPVEDKLYTVSGGDVVTVRVTTSEAAAATPIVTVGGRAAVCSVTAGVANSYTCTRTMTIGDPVGPLAVSVIVNGFAYEGTTDGSAATRTTNQSSFGTVVRIVSNNPVTTQARVGNRVSVLFTNFPGTSAKGLVATIMGIKSCCILSRKTPGLVTCSARVSPKVTSGPATFLITDASGLRFSFTTDGSSVLIDTVRPTFPEISIATPGSAPSSSGSAKPGDRVILSLRSSEALAPLPVVKFGSLVVPCSLVGETTIFRCPLVLPTPYPPGPIRFSVKATDVAGNIGQAMATTDGSKVTVVQP